MRRIPMEVKLIRDGYVVKVPPSSLEGFVLAVGKSLPDEFDVVGPLTYRLWWD